jgi:predicted nucleotidyltransferase
VDIARRLARDLRRRLGSELKEIRLFGSRARGTSTPSSDYDILVLLSRKDPGTVDALYDVALRLELRHRVDISFKVYREEDYRRKSALGTPFTRRVAESSVLL